LTDTKTKIQTAVELKSKNRGGDIIEMVHVIDGIEKLLFIMNPGASGYTEVTNKDFVLLKELALKTGARKIEFEKPIKLISEGPNGNDDK